MSFFLSVFVALQLGVASPLFTPLRYDQTIPAKCRDTKISFFELPIEKFYIGRRGALSMGFTFEYPLERKNAGVLWRYFQSVVDGQEDEKLLAKIQGNPQLKRDHDLILASYRQQDFVFETEGEILELLAIEYLYQEFPENIYFITGGVAYHDYHSPQRIGELDLVVGRRDTCTTVAVGEAKLGTGKMLKKAKDQLIRFGNFLRDHNAGSISGEYKPH